MDHLAAVVLAGGAARRMGGVAKPAVRVAGVTLLTRALAAASQARPRIVVGPPELLPLLPGGVHLLREKPPGGGPVAAAAAGLALLSGHGPVALLASDLPFLSSEAIATMRSALDDTDSDGAVLVDDSGRPQWLCGVWRLDALRDRLAALGHPSGRGMREWVDGLRITRVAMTDPTHPPAWFDCDTDEDVRRAEEWTHGHVG
jgi:molybdenum cofactor guanylyltransferase